MMHNCPVKNYPHDRCPICEIPKLEAIVQKSEEELAPIKARLAAIKAPVNRPRREAISRAASRVACAVRTALFKVRLEANAHFRNMRGVARNGLGAARLIARDGLHAMRLIARDGLAIGGSALRDVGDAMVLVSQSIDDEQ